MARQPGSDRLLHSHSDSSMALSVAETATPGSSLRLASYNLHGWRDTDHADNLQRIIDTLQKINADVVALQEVLHPFRPPSEPAAASYDDYLCQVGGDSSDADRDLLLCDILARPRLGGLLLGVQLGCTNAPGRFARGSSISMG